MRIAKLTPMPDWVLSIISEDGRIGRFNVRPFLEYEAFQPPADFDEFRKVHNGGYFIEWECGADLSADTIEAHWE
jgi:hypothetical protein